MRFLHRVPGITLVQDLQLSYTYHLQIISFHCLYHFWKHYLKDDDLLTWSVEVLEGQKLNASQRALKLTLCELAHCCVGDAMFLPFTFIMGGGRCCIPHAPQSFK
jgi:hypothetical protein